MTRCQGPKSVVSNAIRSVSGDRTSGGLNKTGNGWNLKKNL